MQTTYHLFIYSPFQRSQRSCARPPPLVTGVNCTASATTCPCCRPSPAPSASTRRTRRTSRAGWTAGRTKAYTVSQVQPTPAPTRRRVPRVPTLQVPVAPPTQGETTTCSGGKRAASREGEPSSATTDAWSVNHWLNFCGNTPASPIGSEHLNQKAYGCHENNKSYNDHSF